MMKNNYIRNKSLKTFFLASLLIPAITQNPPILKYNETDGSNAEEANLALVILNGLCPDLNYKYMNGINCVFMNFKYTK